ncbi:DUF6442 family protein [Paenibacillus sp. MER 99-2]|uniref:DUF6442 family protein n=1 Tax=Paenibacillus sp. MER 99-2 TaxID=2939572 RepID=UPI0033400423
MLTTEQVYCSRYFSRHSPIKREASTILCVQSALCSLVILWTRLLVRLLGGIHINKDEILAKSRRENKNRDLFKLEVQSRAVNIGSVVAVFLATVFFVVQLLLDGGFNWGLYAILFSVSATSFLITAFRLKRSLDIVFAIICTLATLMFSFIHIYNLITTFIG